MPLYLVMQMLLVSSVQFFFSQQMTLLSSLLKYWKALCKLEDRYSKAKCKNTLKLQTNYNFSNWVRELSTLQLVQTLSLVHFVANLLLCYVSAPLASTKSNYFGIQRLHTFLLFYCEHKLFRKAKHIRIVKQPDALKEPRMPQIKDAMAPCLPVIPPDCLCE